MFFEALCMNNIDVKGLINIYEFCLHELVNLLSRLALHNIFS